MEDLVVGVGRAALFAAFEAIFHKLASLDVVKYASRNKVRSEVNRWEKELLKMNCVLDNAEERQMSEVPIKKWLDEVRDLAYDVEDILDEFSTEVMREKVKAENEASPSKVRKLISACCSCVSPRDIRFNASLGSKMEEITLRFQRLAKEKEDLKFIEGAGGVVRERLETTSLVQESEVYGRSKDKVTLVNQLLSRSSNGKPVSVVAIVGMGGLGKTTLAQLVYNDEAVNRSFDIKAWVSLSDVSTALQITVKIIEGFTKNPYDVTDLNNAQEKLLDVLRGKRFLLVLDDLREENSLEWKSLSQPLAGGGALGSRVLITTRNEGVATDAFSGFTYPLNKLNPEECASLLARHAVGEGDLSGHPMLEEIGKEIAKKCDGLPLAAVAIGRLLREYPDPGRWSKVLRSDMWELDQDKCAILPALRVSYYYLPSHLKRCFAYCAIFPKDYAFDKDDLIMWWKGEGFLEQSADFFELGNEYFQGLLSRSFFQPSIGSKFVLHDFMNDLARWINAGICFHLPKDKEVDSGLNFENLRHLSFVSRVNEDVVQRFEKFSSSTSLRTFIAFRGYLTKSNAIFGKKIVSVRCLKVLCLSGYQDIEELPDWISTVKQLRHLDMSFTNIRLLPGSISDLLNLQILKLNGCRSLIQLPQEITKLVNLQILDISETDDLKEMPSGIDRLTNLQVLPKFIVGEEHGLRLKELKRLSLIRGELSISRLEHVVDIQDAIDADLKAKEGLVSLKLQWSTDLRALERENQEQILSELLPHTSLKSLEIQGYSGKHLPQWVGGSNFTNLETLILSDCNSASSLLPFERLSSLKTLRIKCSNLTDLPRHFPSLEYLRIEGCSNLTNLPDQFLKLDFLCIEGCSSLRNLPNHLPSLEYLRIKECLNLTNLPSELPLLIVLSIEGCSELPKQLPLLGYLTLENCSNLTNLPDHLPFLVELRMEGCSKLKKLPDELPSLGRMSIEGCLYLKNLPDKLPLLRDLSVKGCSKLRLLSKELPSLEELRIEGCSELSNLPYELPLLRNLSIKGFSYLRDLPGELLSIEELRLEECSFLSYLPNQLPLLVKLSIERCSDFADLPDELPSLGRMSIERCSYLRNLPKRLHSLRDLSIKGCSNLRDLPKELPSLEGLRIEECSFLSNLPEQLPLLVELSIDKCPELTNLPGKLPSLGRLSIAMCPKLMDLPNELPLLKYLTIEECSNLTNLPDRFLLLLNNQ